MAFVFFIFVCFRIDFPSLSRASGERARGKMVEREIREPFSRGFSIFSLDAGRTPLVRVKWMFVIRPGKNVFSCASSVLRVIKLPMLIENASHYSENKD